MNLIKVFLIAWFIHYSTPVLDVNSDQTASEVSVKCLEFLKMCQKDSLRIRDSFKELNTPDFLYFISSVCKNWCYLVFLNHFRRTEEVQFADSLPEGACSELYCRYESITNSTKDESYSRQERAATPYPGFTESSIKTNQDDNESNDDFLQTVINGSRFFDILLRDFPSIFKKTNVDTESEDIDEEYYSDLTVPMPEALSENEDLILDQFQEEEEIDDAYSSTASSTATSPNGISFDVSYGSDHRTKQVTSKKLSFTSETPTKYELSNPQDTVNVSGPRLILENFGDFRSSKESLKVNGNSSDVLALFRSRYPIEEWISLGFFTEDYFLLINRHWMQFAPPYHSSHYILAAIYALVMTVGVTGNCLVIFMFLR